MTTPPMDVYRDNANDAPPLRLHSADAVGMATFLGSPLGGSLLLALNERALGRTRRAWAIVGAGLLVTLAWMALAYWLPSSVTSGVNIGFTLGAHTLARRWLAQASAEGRLGDVQWHSKWRALWVGLAAMATVLVVVAIGAALSLGRDGLMGRVPVRPDGHIYYVDGATADEARRVAARLDLTGSVSDLHHVHLEYARTARGHALSFPIDVPHYDRNPSLAGVFQALGRDLQPRTDPHGVLEVRLCGDDWRPLHTFTFPEAAAPAH